MTRCSSTATSSGSGGKFWDNNKQKFMLQTPEAKKALQFFYDIFYKYEVDSTRCPTP